MEASPSQPREQQEASPVTGHHDGQEPEVLHCLKNHLAIVLGYCDLLLEDFPANDPRHSDLVALRQTAQDAMSMTPQLARSWKVVG